MSYSGFLSTELFWACLKWLIISAIWGVLTFGVYRKDRTYRQLLQGHLQAADIAALLKMLYNRNIQLWTLVTLLVIAGAAGDIHRDAILLPATATAPTFSTAARVPAAANKKTALPSTPSSPLPFLDITEFNEKDSKEQAYIDVLKRRYEAWLVTYYYLQKCGKTGTGDFALIHNSLKKELEEAHAEGTVENNILLAASGSYNEMYSNIPCDNAHLATSKSTYDVNMQQLQGLSQPVSGVNPRPAPVPATAGTR